MYNSNIVSKLLISDDVVTVPVHLIEGLNNFNNLDAGRNERLLDLMLL